MCNVSALWLSEDVVANRKTKEACQKVKFESALFRKVFKADLAFLWDGLRNVVLAKNVQTTAQVDLLLAYQYLVAIE